MAFPIILCSLDLAYLLLSKVFIFLCSFCTHASQPSQWRLSKGGCGSDRWLRNNLRVLRNMTIDLVGINVEKVFIFVGLHLTNLNRAVAGSCVNIAFLLLVGGHKAGSVLFRRWFIGVR